MNVTEKRKSVRIPVNFPAVFSYNAGQGNGEILNLSVDGAYLCSGESLEAGKKIKLSFDLPDHELHLNAQVIWRKALKDRKTFGMGLFFKDAPALQQAAIELFIRNLLKI